MNTKKLSPAQKEFLTYLADCGGVLVFEGANGSQRTINTLWDRKLISVSVEHAPHINIYTVRSVPNVVPGYESPAAKILQAAMRKVAGRNPDAPTFTEQKS